MRRQLPTSNISTSRNDVLFHVTGVLPAIEILKTGAIKCSKPSAWERADWPKLSWPSVCKALPSVRKAPPFRAGMNRTDCVAILFLTLMRYLLLHNGLPNRRNRCAATKE